MLLHTAVSTDCGVTVPGGVCEPELWYLGTWCNGILGHGLVVGLDDVRGLF